MSMGKERKEGQRETAEIRPGMSRSLRYLLIGENRR